MSAQEDFEQIRLQFVDPLQHDYEVVRPIVLHGETAAERSRQTGLDRTTVADKARRFILEGMAGLQDRRTQPRDPPEPVYPEAIAGYIVYLKQLYPPIHLREIERILLRKFGYQTRLGGLDHLQSDGLSRASTTRIACAWISSWLGRVSLERGRWPGGQSCLGWL